MDFRVIFAFCLFILTACVSILLFLPDTEAAAGLDEGISLIADTDSVEAQTEEVKGPEFIADVMSDLSYHNAMRLSLARKIDPGLELYRSSGSRMAVEWFYTCIAEDREVALAILENADANNIPLSLAFALAYTESRYKTTATNTNRNASIDRGLYQLNSQSFPNLSRDEFFDPAVNAKYGMAHLRFCLETAGNEIAALAMYNAGSTKVRTDRTPQMTLNYVSNIMSYRAVLDELFDSEVASFYSASANTPVIVRADSDNFDKLLASL